MKIVEKTNCVAPNHSEMEQQLIQFAPETFSNTTNLQAKDMDVDQEWRQEKTESVPLLARFKYENNNST